MRLQHEGMVDNQLQELVQKQLTYMDAYNSCYAQEIEIVSPNPVHRTDRHVEITGMKEPPSGLYNLLSVTKSVSVKCDTAMDIFSAWSNFHDLEECELLLCHKMKQVFKYSSGLKNLRNVHACNLRSLVLFCSEFSSIAFSSLEHLHLEYCPRLEAMMPDAVTLPCLKTLDILFCYNLKKIFIRSIDLQDDTYQLPNLQRIRLQDLPLL
jgi:hypothetical protein